ncbi:hypothetical protein CPB97_011797 [Podila verticillata]|nr:hypothetical protein CPB97_011797 [Podila verticillata]
MMAIARTEQSDIEAAAKECFVGIDRIAVSKFIIALQKRRVDTRNRLTRIVESTDYLKLTQNNNVVVLTRNTFAAKAVQPALSSPPPLPLPFPFPPPFRDEEKPAIEAAAKECFVESSTVDVAVFVQALQRRKVVTRKRLTLIVDATDYLEMTHNNTVVVLTRNISPDETEYPGHLFPLQNNTTWALQNAGPSSVVRSAPQVANSTTTVRPLTFNCDTDAIVDLLGDIALDELDLEDPGVTDIFIDVGSNMAAKISGEVIQYDRVIEREDVDTILERLPDGAPTAKQSNRVIFGQTLHRLATVTYDGVVTGVTIRVGRSVSEFLPIFEGIVEGKNVLLCGAPNVGKTTMLREICKYLSQGKCLCLIDSSGEVCGDSENKSHIVGTSRVFRPEDPNKQYATLLDCVRNHSPDVIAIDELNTKEEVEVCQTIALRSIRMVAAVHGNIEDLVSNPMLNKALGGSTQALVSDQVAVNGRKVVVQRTTRPIFDIVINIKRTPEGLEYSFIEDVAEDVTRIMEGKTIQVRTRRIVEDEMLETMSELSVPL